MSTYTVATDGACMRNPGPAGWAWVGEDGRWAAGSLEAGTNNIGELLAVLYAIRDNAEVENLHIQADSMYAINTYQNWMDAHARRGWKTSAKEPTKNVDILQALKKILRPSVSGNAIYQEVVFAESMDLFDRMVLTESLGVQTIIVEIARNLCIAHPSSRHGIEAADNNDHLSDDIEQLFELTRIIVLVLAGLIPGLSDTPVSVRLESNEEAQNLVRTSMQALVDVSDVFPNIIKTDLHATILNIFVTILGTGACQATVMPQSLPVFRRFVASIASEAHGETKKQLLNTLARMQAILRNAQKRETNASLPCEKNTLLASTILISTAGSILGEDQYLVLKFASQLTECLENKMTSRVAAGCIRTLLLAGICSRHFFAHAVKFLAEPLLDIEGMDESRSLMAQTLTAFIPKINETGRPAVMALVMSTLLRRAAKEGEVTHHETATRLLELAGHDSGVFRGVVGELQGEEKALMERVLKARAGTRVKQDLESAGEPTIALKMNF